MAVFDFIGSGSPWLAAGAIVVTVLAWAVALRRGVRRDEVAQALVILLIFAVFATGQVFVHRLSRNDLNGKGPFPFEASGQR